MLAPPRAIAQPVFGSNTADALLAIVQSGGSGAHPYVQRMTQASATSERGPIADSLHYLSILHGRQPSLAELAAQLGDRNAPREWLVAAKHSFAGERVRLSQLSVAAGAAPAHRGRTNFEQLVRQQREALLTLVRSDRRGCLVGVVAALLLDWEAVNDALDSMARRIDLAPFERSNHWPSRDMTLRIVAELGQDPAMSRAILFAAQQLIAQHHAFWNLLDARDAARGA